MRFLFLVHKVSQLSAFIAVCRNSLNNWVRREIVDHDPWDEQASDSLNSDSLARGDLQNISVMEPIPKADVPQSSVSMIQQ